MILCSGFSQKCSCDEFLKDLGPDEILSYIYNAKMILSSSFHATAFSLMFEKQFFTILPDLHTNERILDLLTKRELVNRIITSEEQLFSESNVFIDYAKLSSYDAMINSSKAYLKGALANAEQVEKPAEETVGQ